MRATEFITEEAKAIKTKGLVLKYAFNDSALLMKAFEQGTGSPLAFVKFVKEKKELYPQNLWVNDEYRSRGIAKTMYDTLKSEGYIINRSHDQTKAGAGFWDKHRGEDQYVWEAFDTKVDYTVAKATSDIFQTYAIIGNRKIVFDSQEIEPESWEAVFYQSDARGVSYGKTGSGSEMQVFSFIIESMRELISRYRPMEITFTSSKSDENRTSVYARMLGRIQIPGYKFIGIRNKGGDDEFVIRSQYHQDQELDEEVLDEMPLPADWDPQQMRQGATTFKSRLQYALDRAKKLGTGSSRVATIIDYEGRPTVLKIAKNQKGLAQNSVEADILSDGYASQLGILIPIIDYDEQNRQPTWVHTEIAQKANEKQLCQLMGCDNLSQLINMAWAITGKKGYTGNYQSYVTFLRQRNVSEEQIERMSEYANTLADLNSSFDVELGDLARAANWGIYNGKPVIVDVGFNTNVYNQYYKR